MSDYQVDLCLINNLLSVDLSGMHKRRRLSAMARVAV
jgi:hypothetical protein